MKIEDFAKIAEGGKRLERVAADAFREATAAVKAGNEPRVSEPFPPAPPGEPPAPSYGFQDPAPADAPKLEAENITPEEAKSRVDEYVQVLRRFAGHMAHVSRFTDGIADLLEYGTVRPEGHHVQGSKRT